MEPLETITDEEIARRIQKGESSLFGVIIERYEQKLTRYGRKFLPRDEQIEDIVQDVFIKTYQYIKGFDTTRKFSSWIYRIAHNAFINEIKKSHRLPQLMPDFDILVSHTVYEDPAAEKRDIADIRAQLEQSLDKISPNYKEILLLRYFEDMEYKDIAEILQIPLGTVSVRIQRAKQALKESYLKLHP
jgi:RNA polymerase sigma-70 factor (ECF subfamily)